ncbi:hypothetical protein [Streptomyces caelestis]|uniref:hypothetical protein n=1 Tax=Streptomyces caelestis TaxID=36816 RepID=UPI00365845C5
MLGYDPENLTDRQRTMVEESLQEPGQDVFIAAECLAQLKAESDFAGVSREEMTVEQQQELAARYNGGSYRENDQAQRCGRDFAHHLDQARNAIR